MGGALASEAPELVVACLHAARLRASDSLGTLLSSKVNQWTLLVGTIPLVLALSSTSISGLPLDTQQRTELLLTAARSLFAVSLLVCLRLTAVGAATLFVPFAVQFAGSIVLSPGADRVLVLVLSGVYVALAPARSALRARTTRRLARDGTVTPYAELEPARPGLRLSGRPPRPPRPSRSSACTHRSSSPASGSSQTIGSGNGRPMTPPR